MVNSFFLGVDTSAYTTSVAVLDAQGALVQDLRRKMVVKAGQRGLRQSEAFFQHVLNLPELFREVEDSGILSDIAGIAASSRPRPREDSYMPVFLAGESGARIFASGCGASYLPSSHQEGHIMAGLWSAGVLWDQFSVCHLSGGTTEFLSAQRKDAAFTLTKRGGGEDLSAGQFVDRVGIKLGLPFPAGPHLEKLSAEAAEVCPLPVAVKGNQISFSGPETRAQQLINQGIPHAVLAKSVQECIARSVVVLITNLMAAPGEKILFVGGVMANEYIKDHLTSNLPDFDLRFSNPSYSVDNAVGLAEIARQSQIQARKIS